MRSAARRSLSDSTLLIKTISCRPSASSTRATISGVTASAVEASASCAKRSARWQACEIGRWGASIALIALRPLWGRTEPDTNRVRAFWCSWPRLRVRGAALRRWRSLLWQDAWLTARRHQPTAYRLRPSLSGSLCSAMFRPGAYRLQFQRLRTPRSRLLRLPALQPARAKASIFRRFR